MIIKLRRFFIIITILFVTINIGWFYGCSKLVTVINDNFADQRFSANIGGINSEISFHRASCKGYFNALTIELHGFKESTNKSEITYASPIEISYSLFLQKIKLSYIGNINAQLKPLSKKEGIMVVGDFNYYLSYPLTLKLIKTALSTSNYFELINFIDNIQIDFGEAVGYDLKNHLNKIYHHNYFKVILTPKFTKYYRSFTELSNNIPQTFLLDGAAKVDIGTGQGNLPTSLLYITLPTQPLEFKFKSQLYTNSTKFDISNILSDFTVDIANYNLYYNSFEAAGTVNLKVINKSNLIDIIVKSSTTTTVKKPLFDIFKNKILQFLRSLQNTTIHTHNAGIFNQISNNPEKYIPRFHEFGPMNIIVDTHVTVKDKLSVINIDKFSFNNQFYNLELTNKTNARADFSWQSTGRIAIGKYANFIDLTVGYFQRILSILSKLDQSFVKLTDGKVRQTLKSFLRKISNEPKSSSADICLDYNLSNNLVTSTIGSLTIEQIKELYLQTIAQDLIENVIKSDRSTKVIEKLIPQIKDNPNNLLKKIQKESKKLNPDILKKILD